MKVLVCGVCPFPHENVEKSFGPGTRTWHFACALLEAGLEVRVFARRIPGIYEQPGPTLVETDVQGIVVTRVDWDAAADPAHLRGVHDRFAPDALVGATIYGSYDACRLDTEIPVWADQFGHVMAEAQAKASMEDDNRFLREFWKRERTVLLRADVFSTVSDRQRYATIGELGALGRLTKATTGYEFAHTVPCALDPTPLPPPRPMLRGREVPRDAFVVLWSGSYNVWTDVDLLFRSVDAAMERDPDIHFVSTGGAVDGYDTRTYGRFQRLVATSSHRDRYRLLGWRPKREILHHYAEADLGICVDLPIYEGELGSKNRVLDWMKSGLPAVCTEVTELASTLRRERIGFTHPPGDWEALRDTLLQRARDREHTRRTGERARAFGLEHFGYEATARPLTTWAKEPGGAPDRTGARWGTFVGDLDTAVASAPLGFVARVYYALKPALDFLGLNRLRRALKSRRSPS